MLTTDTLRHWFPPLRNLAAVLFLLAPTTGCMLTPFDGQEVTSKTSKISCGGFVPYPNEEVRIQAWNKRASAWVVIHTAYSGKTPYQLFGNRWYEWGNIYGGQDVLVEIPPRHYWMTDGAGREYVLLRTVVSDSDFAVPTFKDPGTWDPVDIEDLHGEFADFYAKTGSGKNTVRVYLNEPSVDDFHEDFVP